MARLSNLDLINKCDAFPYADTAPKDYEAAMSLAYKLVWADDSSNRTGSSSAYPIGYMLRTVFDQLAAIPKADLDAMGLDSTVDLVGIAAATGTVPLHELLGKQPDEPSRTRALLALARYWHARKTFKLLRSWRDEPWPVYAQDDATLLFSIERAAMGLFGTVRYGVHLTAYLRTPAGLKLWVPKRASDKSTYPGMLDNTVAGGLMTGEDPFECVVREADEEASLPETVMRSQGCKSVGTITYMYLTDERAGGEAGFIYPECEWIYDLDLTDNADVIPQPKDGEVESFSLCSVDEVQEQLAAGRYKPNCSVVLLDFLARHGVLTQETASKDDYDAIVARLHRKLPFPGPHQKQAPTLTA